MDFNASQAILSPQANAVGPILAQVTEHATPLNVGYALIGTLAAMQLFKTLKAVCAALVIHDVTH